MKKIVSPSLDTCWLTVFSEVNRRIAKTLDDGFDLTVTQYRVLLELKVAGGSLRGSEFSNLLLLKSSSVTCAFKALDERGYIDRNEIPGDRRSIMVNLTDKGTQIMKDASASLGSLLSSIWKDLSQSQRDLVVESTSYTFKELSGHTAIRADGPVQVFYTTTVVMIFQIWTSCLKRDFGLSMAEFRVLLVLSESEGSRFSTEIVDALILAPSVVSITITSLLERGYVTLERDARDRRNYHVAITDAGSNQLASARNRIAELNSAYYSELPDDAVAPLEQTAQIIYRTLQNSH